MKFYDSANIKLGQYAALWIWDFMVYHEMRLSLRFQGIVKKKIETCLSADGRSREIHLLFDTLQKHKIFEVLFIYHKS